MREVIIPSNMNPWMCNINGVVYSYTAGSTQTVPDEVASLIDAINAEKPVATHPGNAGDVWTMQENGEAAWIGGGGGMVVNFTYTYDEETDTDSITSDKTQDEIIEAMQAGIVVSGKIILDDIVVPVGYAILDFRNGAENKYVAFGFIASREYNNAYMAYHDNESDSWVLGD